MPVGRLESALTKAPWLAGSDYSIADIDAYALVDPLRDLAPEVVNTAQTPRLMAWLARIAERPAVRAARARSRSGQPEHAFVPRRGGRALGLTRKSFCCPDSYAMRRFGPTPRRRAAHEFHGDHRALRRAADSLGAMADKVLGEIRRAASRSPVIRWAAESRWKVYRRAPERITGIALLDTGVNPLAQGDAGQRGVPPVGTSCSRIARYAGHGCDGDALGAGRGGARGSGKPH